MNISSETLQQELLLSGESLLFADRDPAAAASSSSGRRAAGSCQHEPTRTSELTRTSQDGEKRFHHRSSESSAAPVRSSCRASAGPSGRLELLLSAGEAAAWRGQRRKLVKLMPVMNSSPQTPTSDLELLWWTELHHRPVRLYDDANSHGAAFIIS